LRSDSQLPCVFGESDGFASAGAADWFCLRSRIFFTRSAFRFLAARSHVCFLFAIVVSPESRFRRFGS
jgi:hypothetical protein